MKIQLPRPTLRRIQMVLGHAKEPSILSEAERQREN